MKLQFIAMLIAGSAAGLAGCGASLDKDTVEAGLGSEKTVSTRKQVTEKQVHGWSPSSATASPAPTGSGSTSQDSPSGEPSSPQSPKPISGPAAQAADRFATTTAKSAYKIGPLDVLEISVFKVPELSKSVQVADTGTINLPLVGEIRAADRTAQDIERDLTTQLSGKYLRNPQVTVYVREYNSQRATIEGAVKKPGVYPIKGRTTLLQFIAMAESLDRDTASSEVVIFRVINSKRHAAKYDIDEIRGGKAQDPEIQQGDVIVVDTSSSKVFFSSFVKMIPLTAAFVPLL